jgi:hypothetical protein
MVFLWAASPGNEGMEDFLENGVVRSLATRAVRAFRISMRTHARAPFKSISPGFAFLAQFDQAQLDFVTLGFEFTIARAPTSSCSPAASLSCAAGVTSGEPSTFRHAVRGGK